MNNENDEDINYTHHYVNESGSHDNGGSQRIPHITNVIICAMCGSADCDGHIVTGQNDTHQLPDTLAAIILREIIKCICIECSNILISKEDEQIEEIMQLTTSHRKLIKIHQFMKEIKYCPICSSPVSKIKMDLKKTSDGTCIPRIYCEREREDDENFWSGGSIKDEKKQKNIRIILTSERILKIFDAVTAENWALMGLNMNKVINAVTLCL